MSTLDTFNEGHFNHDLYDHSPALKWKSAKAIKTHSVDLKKSSDKFFIETILELMETFKIKWSVETFEERKQLLYRIVGPSVNGVSMELNRALMNCGMKQSRIRKLQFISAKNFCTLVIIIPENTTVDFDKVDIDGIRTYFKNNTFNRVKIRVLGTLKVSST